MEKRWVSQWTKWAAGFVGIAIITVAPPALAEPANVTGLEAQVASVPYAAGGVGLDARAELKNRAGAYNLRMMFAEPNGEFLVPDSVSVRKGNIDVLMVTNAGPLLYVNVPNGTYVVHANYKGVVRTKVLSVAGRMPDVVLTWPADPTTN